MSSFQPVGYAQRRLACRPDVAKTTTTKAKKEEKKKKETKNVNKKTRKPF
jgi:hypothetical protein